MSLQKLPSETIRAHKGVSFTGISTIFFCHDGKENVFMTKRSQNARDERGKWESGGGGLKHGQSVEENLLREIKEEYNVKPLKVDFIGYFDVFRASPEGHPTHWIAMVFAALVDPKKIKINESDMVDDYGWFPVDRLPTPIHSQFPIFFEKHGQKLRVVLKTAKK